MKARLFLGATLLVLGALTATNPSLTGAVVGAPDSAGLYVSIPLFALGAAIIASAVKMLFR